MQGFSSLRTAREQLPSHREGHEGQHREAVRRLRAHAADGRADGALLAERRRRATSTCARSATRRRPSTAGSRRARRRRRRSRRTAAARAASRSRRCSARASPAEAPVASEPILRRLSESELAIVEAADHFNASQFRRTVGGIAKSLGTPTGLDRAALGREPGHRDHGRLGYLLVPVPRHAGLGAAGAPRGARATSPTSSMRRSPSGTRTWSRTAASSRTSPASSAGTRGASAP